MPARRPYSSPADEEDPEASLLQAMDLDDNGQFQQSVDMDRQMQLNARRLDEIVAELNAKKQEEKWANDLYVSRFRPGISPDGPEWKEIHRYFQVEIQNNSILDVLEQNFSEGQRHLLQPPINNGVTLEIQKTNAEDYKLALTGRFKSQNDNLITKLTMLYFGLPVAPLTLNNVINAGNDEADPEDEPEDLPKVQRIIFSEKPLEFLDKYHERSYGYPMLRRVKAKETIVAPADDMVLDEERPVDSIHGPPAGSAVIASNVPSGSVRGTATRPAHLDPINPGVTTVGMRGGAGSMSSGAIAEQLVSSLPSSDECIVLDEFKPPRLNKERLLQAQAGKRKMMKFDPWMKEENRLDRLHRQSYLKDQSVIEPGQEPAAPYFGPSRELNLGVGSSFPEVYAQRLTPTDIGQILDENNELRSKVLERMSKCGICDYTSPIYKPDEMRAHYKEHADQIAEAGKCPVCNSEQWVFMTMSQRKTHLLDHQKILESQQIKEFWRGFQCPVCDIELHSLRTDEILLHMAEHTPGVLRYCDRCSLDLKDCKPYELNHHKNSCVILGLRGHTTPPVFCTSCGKNRALETDKQRGDHKNHCSTGQFCSRCGLNFGPLTQSEMNTHVGHCQSPCGLPKTFCQRCAKNLRTMSEDEKIAHKQGCYFFEPRKHEKNRIIELEAQLEAAKIQIQGYLKQNVRIRDLEKRLQDREAAVKAHQGRFNLVIPTSGSEPLGFGTSQPRSDQGSLVRLGICPFDGCGDDISDSDRVQLYEHLQEHAEGVFFECPVYDDNGAKCTVGLSLVNNGEHLRNHYQHHGAESSVVGQDQSVEAIRELLRRKEEFMAGRDALAKAAESIRSMGQPGKSKEKTHDISSEGESSSSSSDKNNEDNSDFRQSNPSTDDDPTTGNSDLESDDIPSPKEVSTSKPKSRKRKQPKKQSTNKETVPVSKKPRRETEPSSPPKVTGEDDLAHQEEASKSKPQKRKLNRDGTYKDGGGAPSSPDIDEAPAKKLRLEVNELVTGPVGRSTRAKSRTPASSLPAAKKAKKVTKTKTTKKVRKPRTAVKPKKVTE